MAYPPPPKLLFTRQVGAFLHDSLGSLQSVTRDQQPATAPTATSTATATVQTALLVTPSGKLLAYESPLPARTLRTYCSVASSLWTIHAASSPAAAAALGQTVPATTDQRAIDGEDGRHLSHDGSLPVSIAASFGGGAVFVVHRLQCGLLLACSTPSLRSSLSRPGTAGSGSVSGSVSVPGSGTARAVGGGQSTTNTITSASSTPPGLTQSSLLPHSALHHPATGTSSLPHRPASHARPTGASPPSATLSSPPATDRPGAAAADDRTQLQQIPVVGADADANTATATADVGALAGTADADATSVVTAGTSTTASKKESTAVAFAIVRRQVDEMAAALNEKLAGLVVPDENIGLNGFC